MLDPKSFTAIRTPRNERIKQAGLLALTSGREEGAAGSNTQEGARTGSEVRVEAEE